MKIYIISVIIRKKSFPFIYTTQVAFHLFRTFMNKYINFYYYYFFCTRIWVLPTFYGIRYAVLRFGETERRHIQFSLSLHESRQVSWDGSDKWYRFKRPEVSFSSLLLPFSFPSVQKDGNNLYYLIWSTNCI